MAFWNTYVRYLRWALEFLYVSPFLYVTILLAAAGPVVAWLSWSSMHRNWKPHHWLIFLQFLFFPLLLLIAVLGRVHAIPWPRQQPQLWATLSYTLVYCGSLLLGFFIVWRMKGLRGIAIIVFLWSQWLLQAAALIAGQSLSGVWL